VVYGVLAGVWTPRGPLTTFEALSAMLLGLLTGLAAGYLTRTRWTIVIAPLVFVVVFELLRARLTGPSVDGIHPFTTYGLMAFALGRGVHAVLTLAPMMLGATYGAALARRSVAGRAGRRPLGQWVRRVVAGATAAALVLLGILIARPASTDPIVDADGNVRAGSVAELTTVDVGDHELGLMLRGVSTENPVLLFLAGGPGGSELGAMRRHSQALENDFVVATLDQRGTGTSYDQLDPTETLTLDDAVADVVAVTDYLRARFDQPDVYLVGQSWGTTLGVLAVQQHPERYRAFVGVGQMVSQSASDRIFYTDTLEWARANGDDGLVDRLESIGPPPYNRDNVLHYEPALSHEQAVHPYDHSVNHEGVGQMGENLLVEEYTLLDQAHVLVAFLDVFAQLYPQLQGIDFREQATSLEVPVYVAQGRHEAPGRLQPAREWFALLQAPSKQWTWFDTSGHRPLWEQPEEFHDLMITVLRQTGDPG
jgi:pimeloyl-ACP methyl ester carboxylesterase